MYSLDKSSSFHRSILYLCLSLALWLYANGFVYNSFHAATTLYWTHMMYIGLLLIPPTLLHAAVAFSHRLAEEKSFVVGAYSTAIIFISLSMFYPSLGIREYPWGFYPDASFVHSFLIILFFFCLLLSIQVMNDYYQQLTNTLEKKRAQALLTAFAFIALAGVDILVSYGIVIYPFGYLAVLCFGLSIMYSIITHHYLTLDRYTKSLEEQVKEKTKEIAKVFAELKATQLRLIETGKISAVASLSAGILHQVSQPITAIQGFAKFMRKEMKEDDPFYKPAKLIDEQSAYLREMLEDLMELIRHREITKKNIDINAAIKKATDLLTDELRIHRVNWEVLYGENLPAVYADMIHLQQVFMNIVVNALQAVESLAKGSERRLRIVSEFDKEHQQVVVSVYNNGPGLSLEDKNQIFEPFFSTKTKGSGIGLALCKDLIAEHGGTIQVENQKDQGVTFIISLPAAGKDVG